MEIRAEPFEITYPDPTRTIRGQIESPPSDHPAPAVLLCHGFKGFMDWGFFPLLARGLAETGFRVVRFNTSGSGVGADGVDFSDLEAFARDTYTRQLEDIDRVRELLVAGELGPVDPERVALFGHSRGGAMGIVHAAEKPYRAVVTWAAFDDADRFDAATIEAWRATGRIEIPNARTGQAMPLDIGLLEDLEAHRDRLDVLAAARRLQAPLLCVHGTADEAVAHACSERLAAAAPIAELFSIEGAGHTFGATHPLREVHPHLERALVATTAHFERHLSSGLP